MADTLIGTAYAVLDSEGTLTFFRSENKYTAGEGQTVEDIEGNIYTGQVYTGIESLVADASITYGIP